MLTIKNNKNISECQQNESSVFFHIFFSGGHELEWGKEDSFEREGPKHKERNGPPVHFYCL